MFHVPDIQSIGIDGIGEGELLVFFSECFCSDGKCFCDCTASFLNPDLASAVCVADNNRIVFRMLFFLAYGGKVPAGDLFAAI